MVYRLALMLFAFTAFASVAQAGECVSSITLGNWTNPFAGYRSDLTKLEVREICNDQTVPHLQVKAFTACAPRDCTWGRAIAKPIGDTGFQVGYNTFFARRTVTASLNGKRMEVTVFDDFHDPDKMDTSRKFVLWKK